MENNKFKILAVVTLLVGLLGGYFFGSAQGYKAGYIGGYEKSRGEIKDKLIENRMIEPTPTEVRTISGTIRSIGENQFVLESRLSYDPTLARDAQKTITRTVSVSPDTTITVRVVVESTEKPKPGEPIRPFVIKNETSDFKSLKVDEQVIVEAGENIANETQFVAKEIFKNAQ